MISVEGGRRCDRHVTRSPRTWWSGCVGKWPVGTTHVAWRLYRQQEVGGVYRLGEGAVLDEFPHVLQAIGVMSLFEQVHGPARQRELLPCVQARLLYGLSPMVGLERLQALPILLGSDAPLLQLVGCNAPPVCQGIRPRGAAKRQGEPPRADLRPDTLAKNIVKWNLR